MASPATYQHHLFFLIVCTVVVAFLPSGNSYMNLYLNRFETFRLLGLTAELYYIRDGKVNDYALKFVVPVPPHIDTLHFTWQSLVATPMPYSIALSVNDISALGTPLINISRAGLVSRKEQVFRIVLPCTGKVNAEVDVNVYINITVPSTNEVTTLTLKRKKICLKEASTTAGGRGGSELDNEGAEDSETGGTAELGGGGHGQSGADVTSSEEGLDEEEEREPDEAILADPSAIVSSSSPLYIAVGCASGFIFLLGTLVILCYVRSHKRNSDLGNYNGVSSHLSVTKSGHQSFLRVDGQSNNLAGSSYHNGESRPSLPSSQLLVHRSEANFTERLIAMSGPAAGSGGLMGNPTENMGSGSFSGFRRLTNASYASLPRVTPVHHIYSEPICAPRLSDQVAELSVPKKCVSLQERIQEGTFAQIYHGIYAEEESGMEQAVMVKSVSDQASKMQVSLFLQEGTNMYKLSHRHILPVIAACIEDPQRPLLIYPQMNPGNLKLFLQQCKVSSTGQSHTLLTQDLVSVAIQIVRGMIFLHKNQKIHKDLATRNCAVMSMDDESLLVKITDNALSRDIFPNDYHCLGDNENRPVKWLALESLVHKDFSEWSDVWAFGVTLWELMTLGQQPYCEVDSFEMHAYLRSGYRLFQPINCPDNLYDVMVCCWNIVPEERPTFHQLLTCLLGLQEALGGYI